MRTKSVSTLKYIGMYCAVMPKCQRREVEIPCCMFELAYFYASFCMMNDQNLIYSLYEEYFHEELLKQSLKPLLIDFFLLVD